MFFFFNDTATTEIYTLSLHDALPISLVAFLKEAVGHGRPYVLLYNEAARPETAVSHLDKLARDIGHRSEEHTSELQSRQYLVCRLLLEKKKNKLKVYNRSISRC